MRIRIGTRKSKLAVRQTEIVREQILKAFPEAEIELVPIITQGDKQLDIPLASFGGKGVFIRELEEALVQERIDMAVHSAKDMPMEFREGLCLGAVLEREDPRDVLVTCNGIAANDLPQGSVIGTSSLRREIQIRNKNSSLEIRLLRGNVQTRLEKLRKGEYDGILLAAAGLKRLGLLGAEEEAVMGGLKSGHRPGTAIYKMDDLYVEYLEPEQFVPAAGQGAMAVEIRCGDKNLWRVMEALNCPRTAQALQGERSLLSLMGGGCNAPCGVLCTNEGGCLTMRAMYARDGITPVYHELSIENVGLLGRQANCRGRSGRAGEDKMGLTGAKAIKAGLAGERETGQVISVERSDSIGVAKTERTDDVGVNFEEQNPIRQAENLARAMARKLKYQPVSLVGAGPGSMELVSMKAMDCVKHADVIVYDHLIPGSLLNYARLDAELIYAGKCASNHHMTQADITELLIKMAEDGKYVVRLKGGDPFVFGRGAEEAEGLRQRGIPFEIVPGISSCYSVPAYAGIPVTCRGISSSFHVITGHEGEGKQKQDVDYSVLASCSGTLVFLMGLGKLEEIANSLMKYGKSRDVPAAVVSCGTTSRQKQVVSTLGGIAEAVKEQNLAAPAVFVIGEAAGLSERLNWQRKGPLSGCKVMVTGTRSMAEQQRKVLESQGAECIAVSLIEARMLWTKDTERALKSVKDYQWLVFTSRNGVQMFFEGMKRLGQDLRNLTGVKIAAIGRETAQGLKERGMFYDFIPTAYSSEVLAREWIPTLHSNDRVLLLRAFEGSEVLTKELAKAKIDYWEAPLYENWTDLRRKEELNRLAGEVDYVTIASSSAARALMSMAEHVEDWPSRMISIGPVTTRASEKAGLPVYATASEYTASGMADMILADWGRSQRAGK